MKQRLVVVGNGMAGARLLDDVVTFGGRSRFEMTVFGDEPHGNYNRILLSGVLAGEHRPGDIVLNPPEWYCANGITLRAGARVDAIDLGRRQVVVAGGSNVEPYDVLVIATGSRPRLPAVEGIERALVFRTLDDCEQIAARACAATRAVVIGGGLLGLEAARGLAARGLDVHVAHLMPHLMDVQLDPEGAALLQRQLEALGIRISTSRTTAAVISSGDRVTAVAFADGSRIDCDLVVVAAGVVPNAEVARKAGLAVRRGIVVGDDLACPGAEGVYAIGDCAEHRGRLYGLVAPGWEQARVLAERLSGRNPRATYAGSRSSTKLKIGGVDVAVMGVKAPAAAGDEIVSYAEPSRGVYKKLIVRGDRLAGAIVIGDHAIVPALTQAYLEGTPLSPSRADTLFPPFESRPSACSAEELPDAARICDCNSVTKADIVDAVLRGARSLQAVRERTRASTGCGTCTPEVQKIIDLACGGAEPAAASNRIERLKSEKDGLDILADVPALAGAGWQAIPEDDRERLKWGGVFFRRQTPGRFMMRLRMSNGVTSAEQIAAVADVSETFGNGIVDITTRQQIQIRGFAIERLPDIWTRLDGVGLCSLQTGMDNVRNVIGCPLAGLTADELVDASPVVRDFTSVFLMNRAFTNLPRKFNVGISGCTAHCTHAESQDLALTPASREIDGRHAPGFNVVVGGKMGSGGCRIATPLDIFVEPHEAAAVCAEIVLVFRDHGARGARTKARLAFLLESWGAVRFRAEVQRRVGRPLRTAGRDARTARGADHLGVAPQKQAGLSSVGLAVPVGRLRAADLREIARLAAAYGSGDIRLTTDQNVIVPNVPNEKVQALLREPLIEVFPHDPPGVIRGLVACTGIDYCHFSLIETKAVALRTARALASRVPATRRLTMHWSGCPAGCGNHAAADIGLLGKNVRAGDELIEAVDVFVGGRSGPNPKAAVKVLEDVPCDDLPDVLERLIPYAGASRSRGSSAAGT